MAATLLTGGKVIELDDAQPGGESLWVSVDQLEAATGWHLEPEGLCRDERCVPLPSEARLLNDDESLVDIASFARHMNQAVAHASDGRTWAIGAEPPPPMLPFRLAPGVTLPDVTGREHHLASWRGQKVFLVTWASW